MKGFDKEVEFIVKRVNVRGKVEQKYTQKVQDQRVVNYELQSKNSQLRKQLAKLKKVLCNRNKQRSQIKSFDSEIELMKQRLREVFNQSQTLQLTLSKVRVTNRSKNTNKDEKQDSCCCSRRIAKSRKQGMPSLVNHSYDESKNFKIANCNPQQGKKSNRTQYTQTAETWQQEHNTKILSKQAYANKLTSLIQSQVKMIRAYQTKTNEASNVGKITKVGSKASMCVKTCGSVGSIAKTTRIKK